MDAGDATVISSLIGACSTIAVAWITTRSQAGTKQPQARVDSSSSPVASSPAAPSRRVSPSARFFLLIVYLVAAVCVAGGVSDLVNHPSQDVAWYFKSFIPALIFIPLSLYLRKRVHGRKGE
jgi:hypothetical protein